MNKAKDSATATAYKNRIVGHGDEDVEAILFNPDNWRIHPKQQQDALSGILEQVGWVQSVIINKVTGHLVDGHLRVQLAAKHHEKTVPVVYVELSVEEEELVLTTFDPISAFAATDKAKLNDLVERIQSDDARVQSLISEIADREGLIAQLPDAGDAETEDIPSTWGVIIECDDESQQVELLERLSQEGYSCRPLIS